jgi:predicted ATPase
MQAAMQQFASVIIPGVEPVPMAIKVAIAAGPARRFMVGHPSFQRIDVLAGATLIQLAAAEHLARKGEVLLDSAAVAALGAQAILGGWREDAEQGEQFAILESLAEPVATATSAQAAPATLSVQQARPWLLAPVYERLRAGQGEFLTELRPAAALFLRFSGIDYDADERAELKLNAFVQWVQRVLGRYGAALLQLTIGDKGSYLYAAFGAPIAHEDNAARAVLAALELRQPPQGFISSVQIGISQGRMRTGAYGGSSRRTYGVLGDEVNTAARLMQAAQPGQILVSLAARKSTGDLFAWEALPPLRMKGKSQTVTAFALLGRQERRSIRLHEPAYSRPMVGRQQELATIDAALHSALRGRGQIVGIVGEAGMGKSRLVAEAIRGALRQHVVVYAGECMAYGSNSAYLVWQPIWRALFGLDGSRSGEEQAANLAIALAAIRSDLLPRLPLLGAAVNLELPDNDLTRSFDAKLRKTSLEALLIDCLRVRAAEAPLLIVLEDCHWIDPLSHDLLELIGRAIVDLPVLLLLAYRPPQVQRLAAPRVSQLPHFRTVALDSLQPEAIAELVRAKVAQLYGPAAHASDELIAQLAVRSEANPFYIEELLNYLHDQGLDPRDPDAIRRADLPASLHSLVLSRIDRLSEDQRTLVKLASVIGRLFHAALLWGIAGSLGSEEQLRRELVRLSELEITAQSQADPELAYLFKHIVTHEVSYESLPFATRAALHEQIGDYIERTGFSAAGPLLDLLAFHYDRSRNMEKRRAYLLKAGDAAQADYANEAARDYYQRLLPLVPADERAPTLLRLGQVYEVTGAWPAAQAQYEAVLRLAELQDDRQLQAQTQALIGELLRKQGQYAEAAPWLERARAAFAALDDRGGLARALHFAGSLAMHQGDYDAARASYDASLAIRRELNDALGAASLLSNLCIVAYHQGQVERAWELGREALELRRAAGDKLWIGNSLANLGMLALEEGRLDEARPFIEEALLLSREVGDRAAIAILLNNLGNVIRDQGDYVRAQTLYAESLAITAERGDSWALCYLLEDLGALAALRGFAALALRLAGAAAALRDQIKAPLSPPEQAGLNRKLEPARAALGSTADDAWAAGRALDQAAAVALARGMG